MKHRLLDWLFPPFCAACGELLPLAALCPDGDCSDENCTDGEGKTAERTSPALCPTCREKWQAAKGVVCPNCRRREDECGCAANWLRKPLEWAHIVPYRSANDTVGKLLLTAKDENYHSLYDFLADELTNRLEELFPPPEAALVTWLPRSRLRAADAGVDQAKELALRLSERTGFEVTALFDRRKGGMQKELSAKARIDHARTAYGLKEKRPPLKGRTVLLVDDICTTGASMQAAAELLRSEEVERIICLTVAKTRNRKPKD